MTTRKLFLTSLMCTLLIIAIIMLTGCVTTEELAAHRESLAAWERVEVARANANARRFDALAEVARTGGESSKVAVAMAVAGGGAVLAQQASPMPLAPDPEARAFRWASLIVPTATTLGTGYFGYKLGVAQSNNATRTTEAGYAAFASLGGSMRDIARSGFEAIAGMPTGTNINVGGNGNAITTGTANATADNSRRCNPPLNITATGGAGGTVTPTTDNASTVTTGNAGAGGNAPAISAPFTC